MNDNWSMFANRMALQTNLSDESGLSAQEYVRIRNMIRAKDYSDPYFQQILAKSNSGQVLSPAEQNLMREYRGEVGY